MTPKWRYMGCHCHRSGVQGSSAIHRQPKLSEQLSYTPKTYPILVHGVPVSFDISLKGEDIADLIEQNTDAITHPPALQRAELLVRNSSNAPHRLHRSLILHFDDPVIANNCID